MEAFSAETGGQVEPGAEHFGAMLEGDYDYSRPRRREIREATVVMVDDQRVVVDLGAKRDGIVPARDLEQLDEEYLHGLSVGDLVPVFVLDASDRRDTIAVSLNRGLAQQDWLHAEELLDSGENCQAVVHSTNRGGVVVHFGRVRGFVPNSHLQSIPRGLRSEQMQEAKSALIGQELTLAVIEVDQGRRRLVLSERVANRRRQEQLYAELVPGEVRTGIVCNLVNFGAFVDLGGVDGLIHISELDWRHVDHPSEVLEVGEKVEVYVLSVDRERKRIGLSRKRLLADPWTTVTEGLQEGIVIEGVVTHVVDFGAFVDIGQGIEGLVHVSEMPAGDQTRVGLNKGTEVSVRVLGLDPWRRRISLSMRQANAVPQPSESWEFLSSV